MHRERLDNMHNQELTALRSANFADFGGPAVKPLALFTRALTLCAGAALLSACATRPVTEGVTGHTSYIIAQAVRCEMRDSVIDLLARRIAFMDEDDAKTFDRQSLSRGEALAEARLFEAFLGGGYRKYQNRSFNQVIEAYSKTFVAYQFTFDITSTDNLGGSIDLLSTFTRGTISTPIGASFEGERKAKREFVLADRFEELLTNIPTIRECNALRHEDPDLRQPNIAYPIAGKLNLREVVQNFFNLNQSANLVGNAAGDVLPTQSDTLVFTTTLSAGADPKLTIRPLNRGTEVVGAELNLGRERVDVHQLVLSMNLPRQGMLTIAQQRSEGDKAEYERQQQAALNDLERQRVRDIEDENARLRRALLGR